VAGYLTLEEFRGLSTMPLEHIEALEQQHAGWLDTQLDYWSRWLDGRLRKRYAAPFVAPIPFAVRGWLARIVTVPAWLRRGLDANDEQFQIVKESHDQALAEVTEAADSEKGYWDLPLLDTTDGSGVSKGNPRSYTEASPYVWTDRQAETGRDEDEMGSGTGG
jgi:hypothetical protein